MASNTLIVYGLTGKALLIPPYEITTPYSGAPSAKETITIGFIRAGELEKVYNSNNNIAIDYIKFSFSKDVEDLKIIMLKPSTFNEDFLFPPRFIYQIFEIEFRDIDTATFTNAILRFRVDKDWLFQKGFSKEDVKLLRSKENAWEELNYNFIETANPYHIYEAQVGSFSTFAIIAQHQGTLNQNQIIREPPNEIIQDAGYCGNSIIEPGENCLNCPFDIGCAQGEICEYGACTKIKQQATPILPTTESPQKVKEKSSLFYLVVISVILIGLLVAFIIYISAIKRRKQMPARQSFLPKNQESMLLKSYMQAFINEGYSIEEIRRGALKSNWPENMIEEVIKQLNKKA